MKYTAVRPFYGDDGMVRKGQVLDLDKDRAKALGALVKPVEDSPPEAEAKAAPIPENKMDPAPENKAAPAPKAKRVAKEG